MRFSRTLKWTAALMLSFISEATVMGCAAQAEVTGKLETPPPPPPPPPPDQDGDGINDPDDKCPTEKEDGLPPDPKDGCPTNDADKDGIPTPQDKCPNEPETVNGFQDDDGCPDTKPLAQVVGTEVKISEKIMFEKAKAAISPESVKIVQAVADVLKEHPNIEVVEVGGHASKEGDKNQNLALTQQRVDSVTAELVKLGIDKRRLVAQGYGIYCPLDEGTSEESLERNRRVEFKIIYQDGKPTDAKRGCENAEKNKLKLKAFAPPKAEKSGSPPARAANLTTPLPDKAEPAKTAPTKPETEEPNHAKPLTAAGAGAKAVPAAAGEKTAPKSLGASAPKPPAAATKQGKAEP